MIRVPRIGVALAGRRVPFAEVVASMHLFRGERNRLLSRRRRSALSRLRKGKPLPDNRSRRSVFQSPIDSAFIFGPLDEIRLADLPAALTAGAGFRPRRRDRPPRVRPRTRHAELPRDERDLVERALASTGGNKLRVAELVGISRKRLYARLRRYQLD